MRWNFAHARPSASVCAATASSSPWGAAPPSSISGPASATARGLRSCGASVVPCNTANTSRASSAGPMPRPIGCRPMRRVMCLMTVLTSRPAGCLARTQDHDHRLAAPHVIEWIGRKQRSSWWPFQNDSYWPPCTRSSVSSMSSVIASARRRKRRAELVDERRRRAHLVAARHVLRPAHGRWRAERIPALRAAADGQLEQWVSSQPVEIVAVLAADRKHEGLDHLDELTGDPDWIATPMWEQWARPA